MRRLNTNLNAMVFDWWGCSLPVAAVAIILLQTSLPSSKAEQVPSSPLSLKHTPALLSSFEVTAYCPCELCCGGWTDGYTASGYKINKGDRFVAAPEWIPFRTLLAVGGYNGGRPVPVLDRGGAIKGNRLDVLFYEKSQDPNLTDLEWSHQKAIEWGIRKCKVEVKK